MTSGSKSMECLAAEIVHRLEATGKKLVLAESCTGGLVAAALARVPGVSRCLCGSAVTYREETKIRWLGVPSQLIRLHTAVSLEVTCCMAIHALQRTPEATVAAAVTGYLGPDAPEDSDGLYFVAIAGRIASHGTLEVALAESGRLDAPDRTARQAQAVGQVFERLHRYLSGAHDVAGTNASNVR